VFRVLGGDITAQCVTGPGGAPKPIALTGGTGTYRNIGGDGTVVGFGNGTGRLTLHVLSLFPGAGEPDTAAGLACRCPVRMKPGVLPETAADWFVA
jgi:hypothetical protein